MKYWPGSCAYSVSVWQGCVGQDVLVDVSSYTVISFHDCIISFLLMPTDDQSLKVNARYILLHPCILGNRGGLNLVILASVPLASRPGQSVQSHMPRQKLEQQQPYISCY